MDGVDYFLISAFLASILTSYLKKYFSEESSMSRLKDDIIKKSPLIKSSKATNYNSNKLKIQKVRKVALNIRGGVDRYDRANQIQDLVIKLVIFLKQKELRAQVLKIIFTQGRVVLQLVLLLCKINLTYVVDEVSQEVVVIAICTGGSAGFVCSWFSVGAILSAPPTILSVFLLRNLFQQIQHDRAYAKWEDDIKEKIKNVFFKPQKIDNFNKIKLESLNWNRNPAIKEAAERLGIFENPPSSTGSINLDTLDSESNKILDELGVLKKPNPKIRIKAKTVNFRDFIGEVFDSDNELDLDIRDVKVVKDPLRIRIDE